LAIRVSAEPFGTVLDDAVSVTVVPTIRELTLM
jgi:hypothetical protein